MPGKTQNNSENKPVYKNDIYLEFVQWYALPYAYKIQTTGIKDQQQFAEQYQISKDTLSLWKKRPGFEKQVDSIRREWGLDRTPNVIEAVYRSAIKGSARSQKMWLQMMDPDAFTKNKKTEPIISMDDIRFLISGLPELQQEKYNDFLRDLLADCAQALEDNPRFSAYEKPTFEEGEFDETGNNL